jgi:two-component system, sensor histidine kinase LadS
LLFLAGTGISHAGGYILESSYFEDKTNQLNLSQVKNQHFSNFEEVLTGGYKTGTYWVRLKVRASAEELILKIRPPFTDEIELYDPKSPSVDRITGANYSWASQEIESYSFNFALPPSPEDREVFLRIKSRKAYVAYIEIMTLSQYQHADRIDLMINMSFVVFTLILTIWLFVTWLINRELVLGIFLIQQIVALLHTFLIIGFGRTMLDRYIANDSINYLSSLVTVAYPLIGFLANKILLEEYGLKTKFKTLFNALIIGSLAVILLFIFGSEYALKINAILVLSGVTYFAIASIFGVSKMSSNFKANALSINTLQIFYLFSLLFWIIAILPLLGLAPMGEIAMHSLLIYNVTSGLVFFFLLQLRSKALLKQEIIRSNNMEVLADQERKRREEQSMLMAMLSHEIKTPLSVLKLVVDQKVAGSDLEGHANRAVSNINFIINRCLQLGKLDSKQLDLNPSIVNVSDLLDSIIIDHPGRARFNIAGSKDLTLYLDADLLRVIFSNLIENSLKYSPSDSSIELSFGMTQKNEISGFIFHISNDIGSMGAPDVEHVFKKYYRNASATKISGSGLGLFLAYELTNALGGSVFYHRQENQAIFDLWIPN